MMKKRVAIVEDEGIIAMNLEEMLEASGFEVAGVYSSGESLLDTFGQSRADVVLLDVLLGMGMNGIDVAHQLRRLGDVRIVFMTGNDDESTVQRMREVEGCECLSKPFEAGEFLNVISNRI